MTVHETGQVYLIGSGPGDPELLTLKAARLLAEADVVLHDDLVPQPILNLVSKQALVMSVGKRCGRKKITQAAIHDLMIGSARRGLKVARLKAGDPLIFGRAGEEMDALRSAAVPFEVVPGVTAASSAAAFLEVSLTDRRVASKLIVLSGHHAANEIPTPDLWPGVLPGDATLAIYMPGRDFAEIYKSLRRSGVEDSMPCVVVCGASRPEGVHHACPLSELQHLAAAAFSPGTAPCLLLAGRVFQSLLTTGADEGRDWSETLAELAAGIPVVEY